MNLKRILIVDDEIELVDLIGGFLEDIGYNILTAQNGKEAKEKLDSETVDVMILDNMMPIMTGEQLLESMFEDERQYKMNIIFSSGNVQEIQTLKNNAEYFHQIDHLLHKPVRIQDILELIEAN